MEVEDKVELAHIAEVSVQHLDEVMDNIEHNKFVIFLLDAGDKVQGCISAKHIHMFIITKSDGGNSPSLINYTSHSQAFSN